MSEIAVRMQAVTERREALREIAKERAGKEAEAASQPYPEEDERGQQGTEGGMPFEQISPGKIILERGRDDDSAFNWTQFAPWEKGMGKKKPKALNTTGIWLMARREIAQVWREAKGIKKRNPRIDALEREAAMYGQKQEEERLRQEKARAEFEKQKANVDEVLKIVGKKILEEKDNLAAEKAVSLFEDAFGATGKVYNVDWREDGCDIWFEPWEQRWRRSNKAKLPVIYNLKINDRLEVVSCDVIEDEKLIAEQQEVLLERQLQKGEPGESLDEEFLGVDEEDIKAGIEKKIEKVGRLVELKKLKENTWLATVELWDQMRIRNVERKGEGPTVTENVLARVVDGTIVTSTVRGKTSWEREATEGSTELSERATEGSPANSGEESEFELGAAQQK